MRLALAVVGSWLGLLVASWLAATLSFRTADRLAADPRLEQRLPGAGASERRAVVRHFAAESNRALFGWFVPAQLALGGLALGLAWPVRSARMAVAAAVILTLSQWALAGPMLELGRSLDFVPRPLPPDVAGRFGRLHAGYVVLDLIKAGLLAVTVWMLVRPSGGTG